jgi:prolyl 4-hydroxylase
MPAESHPTTSGPSESRPTESRAAESLPAESRYAASRIELEQCVQVFDGALTPEFCTQMIDSFNQVPQLHVPNGRGLVAGLEGSAWTELNLMPLLHPGLKGFFFQQIDEYLARYNRNMPMQMPVPSRPTIEDIRIKRYRAGTDEKFEPHYDAANKMCNRYLVFLWYLNDVAAGGETEFADLGLRVQARTGRLLMFPPYWMFQHAGLPPVSHDKYIVSTYLMF